MSKLKFYHITRKENRESILENGLVPFIGANRLRCRRRDERESKDARISLCSFEEIEKWKDNIYKKVDWKDLVVFECVCERSDLRVRHWKNGDEYGCWDVIRDVKEIKRWRYDFEKENAYRGDRKS